MVTCAACGTTNPAGARFCNGCGAKLDAAAAPAEREERRTVTVLFADLAGFTARAETLDPEDVRAFLVPYYDVLTAEVTRHGGRVDRFLGDGIMAVFGAPVAHEDDPERAVRAALRITERLPALGLELHARLGINTGEVLFAAATGPGREDAVTGDAVNTAARLQAAAPVDAVVVGEATWRATAHAIRYAALPPVAAKGKAELVPAWRALEPVARAAGALPEESTPFLGRDHELATLVRRFERSRSTPSLEVVTIVAEPGLGKSRLVRELARHVDALPELVTWRVGRCLPYGEGIGFWALSEIVKAQAGILDTDDQVTLAAKLDAAITEPDPSLRRWLTQRLGPLVGLEVTAQPPQAEEASTAWRRFLESLAAVRPLVLIVEDLHWADPGFVAFLRHLADKVSGLPVLLVVTARPELEERHPAWLARARRHTVLSLDALANADMTALLAATLPGTAPELLATILERAAGSPLYAEQLAAMVRDRPLPIAGGALDEAAIPPTIAALLAARIDALPPDARSVLLDASVVGRTCWSGAVAALGGRDRAAAETLLAELARRDLVRPVHPGSMAGEAEYRFVHALLRDVAYGELTRAARLTRHRAAAAWLTERAGAALGEDAEIVAAHLERALELAEAAGVEEVRAEINAALVGALLATADHALATQPASAERSARRGIALLPPDDPRKPELLRRLSRALQATGDWPRSARALEEAITILRSHGDEAGAAELATWLAYRLRWIGEAARAEAVLDAALPVLERSPGPALVEALVFRGWAELGAKRLDAAAGWAGRAEAVAGDLGIPLPPSLRELRGSVRFWSGDVVGGEDDLRATIAIRDAAADIVGSQGAREDLAMRLSDCVSSSAGLAAWDEALAFSASHGFPAEDERISRAEALVFAGRWDEVVEEAARLRPWAVARGLEYGTWVIDLCLAMVRFERGEPLELEAGALLRAAGAVGEDASRAVPVEVALAVGASGLEGGRALLAELLAAVPAGALDSPAGWVRACLRCDAPDLARRVLAVGVIPYEMNRAEAASAAGLIAEHDGDHRAAVTELERAVPVLRRLEFAPELAHALASLGRCLVKVGETEDGVVRLREARELWVGMKAAPRIADVDATLSTAVL